MFWLVNENKFKFDYYAGINYDNWQNITVWQSVMSSPHLLLMFHKPVLTPIKTILFLPENFRVLHYVDGK